MIRKHVQATFSWNMRRKRMRRFFGNKFFLLHLKFIGWYSSESVTLTLFNDHSVKYEEREKSENKYTCTCRASVVPIKNPQKHSKLHKNNRKTKYIIKICWCVTHFWCAVDVGWAAVDVNVDVDIDANNPK